MKVRCLVGGAEPITVAFFFHFVVSVCTASYDTRTCLPVVGS